MYLNAEQILATNDVKTEVVDVPEWGGQVLVREMSGADRDEFESSLISGPDRKANLRGATARLVAMCTVDENMNNVFTPEQADILGRKSATALRRVAEVAQRLSGLTKQHLEEKKGNSDGAQSADSTSSSPNALA